jgi:hypothetical protein
MNDVTYVEAARILAQRMMIEGGNTPESRVNWVFRMVTSRLPDEEEKLVLLGNLDSQLEYFRGNPKEAAKLLAIGKKRSDERLDPGELAAYATTASLILNLDETITKQ